MKADEYIENYTRLAKDALSKNSPISRNELKNYLNQFKKINETEHYHVAGTTKGLHIDTCAKCDHDIRHPIHIKATK